MRNITHVFFDLDHTLWDFETNSREALNEIFELFELHKKGIRSPLDFIHVYEKINHKMWDEYRKGTLTKAKLRKERFPKALSLFAINDNKLAAEINEYYLLHSPQKTNLFDHAISTLEYLKNKYNLYIITNGFEEIQEIKMRNSGLEKYFQKVITSEKVGVRKPHAQIFEFALRQASATPNKSVMIGDDLQADILGAQQVGMVGIYFNPKEAKHQTKVDKEIYCLSELKRVL